MNFKAQTIDDKKVWDDFVTGRPSSFFQSWNWGEFQKTLGKEVLRIGFFDDERLVGAANCVVIKAKRGSYLYIRNGPVMNWSDESLRVNVINYLRNYARGMSLSFLRISPHIKKGSSGASFLSQFPESPMADVDALDTWILDITQSEEDILKNMRKTTRYEINKAKKLGVEIIKSNTTEYFDDFYNIYLDTIKRQGWTGYSKEFIKTQFETFVKDDSALLYLAKYNNEFIAASIFIYYGDSSNYHYSGSLTSARKIPGPTLIQWENILEAKQRGLKRYNFWGIAPENKPNHPWHGLSFFKTGFGGFEERWFPTRDIPISASYWITNIFERFDKLRKGY